MCGINKHQQYLGFSWCDKFFIFLVLPFGLSTAPYCFTKCTRSLIRHWREIGITIFIYLDDGLGFHKLKEVAQRHADTVKQDLLRSGLLANDEKSTWTVKQKLVWLGHIIDLNKFEIGLPTEKVDRVKDAIESLITCPYNSARNLAKTTGKIISMGVAFGNITLIMTKAMYCDIAKSTQSQNWDTKFWLSKESKAELQFWRDELPFLQPRKIKDSFTTTLLAFSDASATGGGGILQHNEQICHIMWTTMKNS